MDEMSASSERIGMRRSSMARPLFSTASLRLWMCSCELVVCASGPGERGALRATARLSAQHIASPPASPALRRPVILNHTSWGHFRQLKSMSLNVVHGFEELVHEQYIFKKVLTKGIPLQHSVNIRKRGTGGLLDIFHACKPHILPLSSSFTILSYHTERSRV